MFINSNNNKDLKLQNHVLVWNFTDWDALSSLVIITVSSYMENVDQYTEQK